MVRHSLSPSLHALAERQLGVVTRGQLLADGLSAAAVRRRLVSEWRLVLPGVVSLGRQPLAGDARLIAALLMAGPDGVVTGAAAARRHGLTNVPGWAVHVDVLVPFNHASRAAGFVRILRTRRMPDGTHHDGPLVLAPVARAVADLCRVVLDERDTRAVVIEAVQKGRVSVDALQHELLAGPRRGSAPLRRGVDAAASGAWSAPEHDLLLLLARSPTLPHAWPNPRLTTASGQRLPTPDAWFDDVGLAIQVHSQRHHAASDDWARTVRADSALAEAGVLRLSVTPREIISAPRDVLARVERLYGSLRASDRPAVVMTPRTRAR